MSKSPNVLIEVSKLVQVNHFLDGLHDARVLAHSLAHIVELHEIHSTSCVPKCPGGEKPAWEVDDGDQNPDVELLNLSILADIVS